MGGPTFYGRVGDIMLQTNVKPFAQTPPSKTGRRVGRPSKGDCLYSFIGCNFSLKRGFFAEKKETSSPTGGGVFYLGGRLLYSGVLLLELRCGHMGPGSNWIRWACSGRVSLGSFPGNPGTRWGIHSTRRDSGGAATPPPN